MKRIIFVLGLLCISIACAHKDAGKSVLKLSGNTSAPEVTTAQEEKVNAYFDSTLYIGYVDYFPETQEFFTALFFKDGFDEPDEEMLASKLDSLIFSEEDWSRERLPMKEAQRMLVLSGLDTIYIFNRRHQLVSKATLSRVEYLWDGMEGYFIGVFDGDKEFSVQTEELYGISSHYLPLRVPAFSCDEIEDEKLNNKLLGKLHIDPFANWDMRHFKINPEKVTYSIVSTYKMNSEEGQSYLTELRNNEVKVLSQQTDDYHYLNILPLPMQVNNQPLLLISAGYPSSDFLWDYLAAFDGSSYQPLDYNRIHPKSLMSIH
jgi:hypothetical protein